MGDRGREVVLPRAVRLHGARPAARLIDQAGTRSLAVPASGGPMRQRFFIHDNRDGAAPDGPPSALTKVFDGWIAGLSNPVDGSSIEPSAAFRQSVAKLALGVIERAGIDWDWFVMRAGRAGMHSMTIAPGQRRKGGTIAIDGGSLSAGRMTSRLAEAFDALVGNGVHVSEGHSRGPGDMPSVMIGWPCHVRVESGDETALSRMSAVAAVPEGAAICLKSD